MRRPWRGGLGARIYCGPYVTWLAESLGVFDRYSRDRMREGPQPCFMNVRDLQSAGILTYTDPVAWADIRPGPQFGGVRQVMEESRRVHEQGQHRLEDGMRYMMEGLRLGVPHYLRQP
ncbi:hypothetical protein L1987_60182 [Smallanthus sonchifolius]|uniref:Uncharacterized protein n=1 Tax=Smallanthus sonchifolius TaxID=185202 RepID=A0ACB9D7R6_9ASTR|nr:hypothetical protein L1987_60182 [Smallanthus sonchifolius]